MLYWDWGLMVSNTYNYNLYLYLEKNWPCKMNIIQCLLPFICTWISSTLLVSLSFIDFINPPENFLQWLSTFYKKIFHSLLSNGKVLIRDFHAYVHHSLNESNHVKVFHTWSQTNGHQYGMLIFLSSFKFCLRVPNFYIPKIKWASNVCWGHFLSWTSWIMVNRQAKL